MSPMRPSEVCRTPQTATWCSPTLWAPSGVTARCLLLPLVRVWCLRGWVREWRRCGGASLLPVSLFRLPSVTSSSSFFELQSFVVKMLNKNPNCDSSGIDSLLGSHDELVQLVLQRPVCPPFIPEFCERHLGQSEGHGGGLVSHQSCADERQSHRRECTDLTSAYFDKHRTSDVLGTAWFPCWVTVSLRDADHQVRDFTAAGVCHAPHWAHSFQENLPILTRLRTPRANGRSVTFSGGARDDHGTAFLKGEASAIIGYSALTWSLALVIHLKRSYSTIFGEVCVQGSSFLCSSLSCEKVWMTSLRAD